MTPPMVSSRPGGDADADGAGRGRQAAEGDVAIPGVLAGEVAAAPADGCVEAGAVQGQEIVEDLEPDDRVGRGVEGLGRISEDGVRVGRRGMELANSNWRVPASPVVELIVDDRAALRAAALRFGGVGPGTRGRADRGWSGCRCRRSSGRDRCCRRRG